VSAKKIGDIELQVLANSIVASLSTLNLYGDKATVVAANSGTGSDKTVTATFTVPLVYDGEVHSGSADDGASFDDDGAKAVATLVEQTLAVALESGQLLESFADAASKSESDYYATFTKRELYTTIDVDLSIDAVISSTAVTAEALMPFFNSAYVPTPAPSATVAPTYAPSEQGAVVPAEFKVNTLHHDALQATTFYPWGYIVEPHKQTVIEMRGCSSKGTTGLYWEVTYRPVNDANVPPQVSVQSPQSVRPSARRAMFSFP
jgi:hypothetical protein